MCTEDFIEETSGNGTFTYVKCMREFYADEMFEFDDNELCEDCYNEYTVSCDNCGDRIWRDETYSDDNIYLCQDCYDNHYYRCHDCDCFVHQDNAHYHDGNHYCQTCYDELDIDGDGDGDDNDNDGSVIQHYNYKPYPIFYGDGVHYGLELEVDNGGEKDRNADMVLNIGNHNGDRIYIKHDGSLSDGFEIVSHPMTLHYHQYEMNWRGILNKLIEMGYQSHEANTCGIHVHIERSALGRTTEKQEETISNILYFVEWHWHDLLKFSRRTQSQIDRWARRYGYKDNPKEILDYAKKGNWGRYVSVNLLNDATIELRMFRGTLKYSSFIAILQLVDEICRVALSSSEADLKALTWMEFVRNINILEKAELVEYLKFKDLYVNDPVSKQEDDI